MHEGTEKGMEILKRVTDLSFLQVTTTAKLAFSILYAHTTKAVGSLLHFFLLFSTKEAIKALRKKPRRNPLLLLKYSIQHS